MVVAVLSLVRLYAFVTCTGTTATIHAEPGNCYFLAAWNRVLRDKLTGSQLVKKFPPFYGSQRFIVMFTRACHLFIF
jgi:hypothetical protein